ncbi:MAG: hypothetical protein ISS18_03000 [Bacteroidales bacterium]|nr:hypothetical protein [Bacteroidales bacterium]
MDLKGKTLEEWLKKPPKSLLKKGDEKDYSARYEDLKQALKPYHDEVTKAAILTDIKEKSKN